MNIEEVAFIVGNATKARYGVNPYQEICSNLIKKGMNENEVKMMARRQGIDFDDHYDVGEPKLEDN